MKRRSQPQPVHEMRLNRPQVTWLGLYCCQQYSPIGDNRTSGIGEISVFKGGLESNEREAVAERSVKSWFSWQLRGTQTLGCACEFPECICFTLFCHESKHETKTTNKRCGVPPQFMSNTRHCAVIIIYGYCHTINSYHATMDRSHSKIYHRRVIG